ncbi:hypothetical protein BFC18_18305 [Alteromonas confluentis]|uniref:OmpR/PhoB-type domain-containing protein n=2 Tax=Alteromonas confluentis TaxID=1656094 RepID=A0A1E7Z7B0_9ALTE|nr:hypothetical protein BFC18_18305 [Alteromonas confluentis]
MAVLVYLAEHAHTVVSQEALYNAVWPRGIFNPGVLQRCIAQLRKALSDDAKNPVFIKTHPKRGYSLEATPERKMTSSSKPWLPIFVITVAVLLLTIGFVGKPTEPTFTGRLTAITSSDSYDFYPAYTQDEKSLAFIRQSEHGSQIVVIDSQTGKEMLSLNKNLNYQGLAWAADGLTLY